jgi:hypothetical protein
MNINEFVVEGDFNDNFEFSPLGLIILSKSLLIEPDNLQINQVHIPPLNETDLKHITLIKQGSFLFLQLLIRHPICIDIDFSVKGANMNKSLISNYNIKGTTFVDVGTV